jgi:urease accessory protein
MEQPVIGMGRLRGALKLRASVDDSGRCFIADQYFSAPFHLSKSYWDGAVLAANVVNPTAGILSGDEMRMNICVDKNARLLLTTPAATRAFTMPSRGATMTQNFRVAAGAWLEVRPELFIPQRGARYTQVSRIDYEPDAELFFAEMLAPGRVARGECFEFEELRWTTVLSTRGRPVFREIFTLAPGNVTLRGVRDRFPTACFGACLVVCSRPFGKNTFAKVMKLHSSSQWIGVSEVEAGIAFVRLIAADTFQLKTTLAAVRAAIASDLPLLRRHDRKL